MRSWPLPDASNGGSGLGTTAGVGVSGGVAGTRSGGELEPAAGPRRFEKRASVAEFSRSWCLARMPTVNASPVSASPSMALRATGTLTPLEHA